MQELQTVYEGHLISNKILLPNAAKKILGEAPVINRAFETGLIVYSRNTWHDIIDTFEKLEFKEEEVKFVRYFTRGATELNINSSSIEVPKVLLEYAQITNYFNLFLNENGIQIYSQSIYNKLNLLDVDGTAYKFKEVSSKNAVYLGKPIFIQEIPKIIVSSVNTELLNKIKNDPRLLYKISSRQFEEIVAELLIERGFEVKLTKATCDGGVDIYVAQNNLLGSFLYLVECKQYSPEHKVGVNVLRSLYGSVEAKNATAGILVTTSYFSKPAITFQQPLTHKLSLVDFNILSDWLNSLKI